MTSSAQTFARLEAALAAIAPRIVACSGGIDSMLLATLAYRASPSNTLIAHALSPAVPTEATERLKSWAAREHWTVEFVSSGEFADEKYLAMADRLENVGFDFALRDKPDGWWDR